MLKMQTMQRRWRNRNVSTGAFLLKEEAINRMAKGGKIMKSVGVTTDKLEAMTDDAMKSGNIKVNPRYTSREDILNLYRKAYG